MRLRELFLVEIEKWGAEPKALPDEQNTEFVNPQQDLFKEIPTLDPNIPDGYQMAGKLGPYRILYKTAKGLPDDETYLLLDRDKVIGYVAMMPLNSPLQDYPGLYWGLRQELNGEGLKIAAVEIDRAYAGQNLMLKMYLWLLQNKVDYIAADHSHSSGAMAVWAKMLRSQLFDVWVYDPNQHMSRPRRPGMDWAYVYKKFHLIPWITLAGKAHKLTRDPDGEEDVTESE